MEITLGHTYRWHATTETNLYRMSTRVCVCVRHILQCFNQAYTASTRCSSVSLASTPSALR